MQKGKGRLLDRGSASPLRIARDMAEHALFIDVALGQSDTQVAQVLKR